jgi:hypothetical protein
MKELLKYIIGIVLIIGVVWIILSRIFSGSVLSKKNNVGDIVRIDNTPAAITTDKNGATHATKQVINVDNGQKELYLHKELDSLRNAIGVKDDQIAGLTTLVSKYKYEVRYTTDSTSRPGGDKRYIIDQTGPWFSAKGIIPGPDPIIISGRDSTSLAFIKKNGKLFADVSSANPDMQYYGVRSFMVPEQTKNAFGIGFNASGVTDRSFKYQNTILSGGARFMHIGDRWMYDAGGGVTVYNDAGPKPYVSIGIYRRLF